MAVLADIEALVREGVLTHGQAQILRSRSRAAMLTLAFRSLLCGGILAAAGGFVLWLADPAPIALAGLLFLTFGGIMLAAASDMWRIFGHSAVLIGAGMLIGGGALEVMRSFEPVAAGLLLSAAGFLLALPAGLMFQAGPQRLKFLSGFLLLAALALHLYGLLCALDASEAAGATPVIFSLYATLLMLFAGWLTDLRPLSALAILPFAQMLETGTDYFHAVYVFYSPEPSFSILQMALAGGAAFWLARSLPAQGARHAGIFAVMAFIVGNMCFLTGSLWGDTPGATFALRQVMDRGADGFSWEAASAARRAFEARALHIPAPVFAIVWAVLLAVVAVMAARGLHRGLFNTALTFAAIHAYTQLFESFGDDPLAWVIGGLSAIPLAWAVWRMNQHFG